MEIHPTAVVSPKAEIASGVKIGPYSVIGDYVVIGRNTVIEPHVVIEGRTLIGEENHIYSFVSLGSPPQDISYKGEDTSLIIGNHNVIKEYATMNRASTKESWETVVGDRNFFMAYTHVAHDCRLGNHIVLANAATLGGHTTIGDHVNVGGLTGVHQFVRIGAHAFVGAMSRIGRDIPPYMLASGFKAKLFGVNQKGLQRTGYSQENIDGLKKAFQIIWRESKRVQLGIKRIRQEMEIFPELEILLDFLRQSKRGILR